MLNPYFILVALLALLGTGFSGYRYGKHVCQGEQATAIAAAQNEAITRANLDVEAATKRAVEQAKAEAAARLSATKRRIEGERDATLKARPDCVRDQQSMELLQSAIDLANGQSSTGNTMSDSVQSPATTN